MARAPLIDPAQDLFAAAALPPGLHYTPEFLASGEEQTLRAAIGTLTLVPATYHAYTARRRVAGFGMTVDFAERALQPAPPMPDWLHPLRERVARALGVEATALSHALVTEYAPGTPLGWHRDAPAFGEIAGVSLAAACEMRWRPLDAPARVLRLRVDARSLYLITGAARSRWQHAVAPTQALRYSITFRTLRPPHPA
ncbi:MAG: alpha-ketoglutarate-dependent dioxygenase AlkB [Burkholderiaceae bacterium]|nr:alpha-ketoglutarate-dependent dioxygenase AlkB [Burkholderiaceae bacterium]